MCIWKLNNFTNFIELQTVCVCARNHLRYPWKGTTTKPPELRWTHAKFVRVPNGFRSDFLFVFLHTVFRYRFRITNCVRFSIIYFFADTKYYSIIYSHKIIPTDSSIVVSSLYFCIRISRRFVNFQTDGIYKNIMSYIYIYIFRCKNCYSSD